MKKIFLILMLLASFSMVSCEGFLEKTPKGTIDEEDVIANINDLQQLLNSVYSIMQSHDYQQSELLFGEACGDDVWTDHDFMSDAAGQLVNFQFNTDNSLILARYQVNYQGIFQLNEILRSIAGIEVVDLEQYQKTVREMYGQAKFLRAQLYFNLVKTYGGVVIQPEEQQLKKLIRPRASLDEVYAYIEKDLRESLLLLSHQSYKNTQAGQVAIGASLGLLMKVLVYQASPGVPTVGVNKKDKWMETKEIGDFFIEGKDKTYAELIKLERYSTSESWDELARRLRLPVTATPTTVFPGGDIVNQYGLMPQFGDNFRVSGEFSIESLFELSSYDYSGTSQSNLTEGSYLIYHLSKLNASYVNVVPTAGLMQLFNRTASNEDPRRLFTFCYAAPDAYWNADPTTAPGHYNDADKGVFNKYVVFTTEGGALGRNYRAMRYADALLLYAEAINELGDQVEAVRQANKVRQRAMNITNTITNGNTFALLVNGTYEQVKAQIENERHIELAGELDRFWDICRKGVAAKRLNWLGDNGTTTNPAIRWKGKYFKKGINEIFPIPQREVFISNGAIAQNPGY